MPFLTHKSGLWLTLLWCPIALSSAYQWTDSDGQVHFSQTPPPGVEAKEVPLVKSPPPPPPSATDEKIHQEAQSISEQIEEEKVKTQTAAEDKKRLEQYAVNCQRAKKYLAELNSKVRIRLTDLQGNMKILTPAEKQQEIDSTNKAIDFYCNPPKSGPTEKTGDPKGND